MRTIIHRYSGEVLREVDGDSLRGADLSGADLRGADLRSADLSGADLRGADLRSADLYGADLSGADLRGADLRSADLRSADLSGVDLSGADLSGADLSGADLSGAKNIPPYVASTTLITPEGELLVWKKCYTRRHQPRLVKLRIPAAARRHNATSRKCRAEYAEVIKVCGGDSVVYSSHNPGFAYRVGATVRPDFYEPDRWQECAGGIHFFLTREEAEAY